MSLGWSLPTYTARSRCITYCSPIRKVKDVTGWFRRYLTRWTLFVATVTVLLASAAVTVWDVEHVASTMRTAVGNSPEASVLTSANAVGTAGVEQRTVDMLLRLVNEHTAGQTQELTPVRDGAAPRWQVAGPRLLGGASPRGWMAEHTTELVATGAAVSAVGMVLSLMLAPWGRSWVWRRAGVWAILVGGVPLVLTNAVVPAVARNSQSSAALFLGEVVPALAAPAEAMWWSIGVCGVCAVVWSALRGLFLTGGPDLTGTIRQVAPTPNEEVTPPEVPEDTPVVQPAGSERWDPRTVM